mgnify:CR=1 FL=1
MEATVFAAYETSIDTAILEETTSNHTISSGSISIDNTANREQYPILEITSDNSVISEIEIGSNVVQLDKTITTGDILLLDFKNQEYSLNDVNILEDLTFNTSDRPILLENAISDVNISFTNSISVTITYDTYSSLMINEYVQDFRISVDKSFISDSKFKKNNKDRLILNTENFNISFSNMAYNWNFYNALENNETIRITYNENHTNGDKEYTRHLVGVKFNTYERYFRDGTGIIFESLVGEGTKLL